jgi:hypothetical protein
MLADLIISVHNFENYAKIANQIAPWKVASQAEKLVFQTIITPTKSTLLLLKVPDLYFMSYILPLHVSTRVGQLQGA